MLNFVMIRFFLFSFEKKLLLLFRYEFPKITLGEILTRKKDATRRYGKHIFAESIKKHSKKPLIFITY